MFNNYDKLEQDSGKTTMKKTVTAHTHLILSCAVLKVQKATGTAEPGAIWRYLESGAITVTSKI
jgi:hypothetical protein